MKALGLVCGLAWMVLAPAAAQAEESGWVTGGGGKVYGDARTACQAFFNETKAPGLTYIIERMESTDGGDQRCYFKNVEDGDPAVSFQLVFRARRTPLKGTAYYRGSLPALRATASTVAHFMGPGVYYASDPAPARAQAIADMTFAWVRSPSKPAPAGVVVEVDVVADDIKLLDFTTGDLRAEFETQIKAQTAPGLSLTGPPLLAAMEAGQVNPVIYHTAFTKMLAAKQLTLSKYQAVLGPDYRFGTKLLMVRDDKLVKRLDKGAGTFYPSVAMPSEAEVRGLLETVLTCVATTNSNCKEWSRVAGTALLVRRGWRANHVRMGDGLHFYLRLGDLYIDGTYKQFHLTDKANADAAALFVGTEAQLKAELAEFPQKPGEKAEDWFGRYFGPAPDAYTLIDTTKPQRFGFDAKGRGVLMEDGN